MEAKFSDLVKYFEMVATNHHQINHSDYEKHFFRMQIDEVINGLNSSRLNFPALILEEYSFSFTDHHSDNILKTRTGAFILLEHLPDRGNYDLMHEIWDKLEIIGTDILLRMKADKRNPETPVVRHFDFNSVEAMLLMNKAGSNIGVRFVYNLTGTVSSNIDNTTWKDYGLQ